VARALDALDQQRLPLFQGVPTDVDQHHLVAELGRSLVRRRPVLVRDAVGDHAVGPATAALAQQVGGELRRTLDHRRAVEQKEIEAPAEHALHQRALFAQGGDDILGLDVEGPHHGLAHGHRHLGRAVSQVEGKLDLDDVGVAEGASQHRLLGQAEEELHLLQRFADARQGGALDRERALARGGGDHRDHVPPPPQPLGQPLGGDAAPVLALIRVDHQDDVHRGLLGVSCPCPGSDNENSLLGAL
jgi:hypothetical protein